MRLSLERASAVRLALIERGVDGNRLIARVSPTAGVVCKQTREICWERERRVEFATLRAAKSAETESSGVSDAQVAAARASDKPTPAAPATSPVPLEQVLFARGSASLGPASLPALDLLAGFLKANAGALEIEGHAATNEHNPQELAKARAEAVRRYMMACGVAGESLIATSRGSARPACWDRTDACRARNRRVELRFPQSAGEAPATE
jgi:outer membrane protein OmpA-like peptidoglycan-associated protein